MPKLLFLVSEPWVFISHRLHLGLAAKLAGFDVYVMTRNGDACREIESFGISVIPFEMSRRGINPFKLILEIIAVARVFVLLKPDIVHHVAIRPIVVGGLAARLVGINNVVSAITGMGYVFTNGRHSLLQYLVGLLLRHSLEKSEVIVQNPDDSATVSQLGVPINRIHLIAGAGVNTKHFVPIPEQSGIPVVLLASRLLWDKGVGEFVEAARILAGTARFVIVGQPDISNPTSIDNEHLLLWVKEGIVEYWGHRDDMSSIMSLANIVCLPSYREGLPKVLLEAMAASRAIVTTDVPGCRDAVRNLDNGLLVPVKNVELLAAAIMKLLGDPLLRDRMGKKGRLRAINEFSQESVSTATILIYKFLINRENF